MSILNVWDIFKPHNSLVLAHIKVSFDKQFQLLKGFTALLKLAHVTRVKQKTKAQANMTDYSLFTGDPISLVSTYL